MIVSGKNVSEFYNEIGGHRIQRVPPTEKKGRVHTSTVTVSVHEVSDKPQIQINDSDLSIEWFSGTGKGGQHRNRHQNSCRVTHVPSGLIETRQGRKRETNLKEAKGALLFKLQNFASNEQLAEKRTEKRSQVGSGMRGDKTFTIRFQDDQTVCHITGKSMSTKRYMKGHMNELWC